MAELGCPQGAFLDEPGRSHEKCRYLFFSELEPVLPLLGFLVSIMDSESDFPQKIHSWIGHENLPLTVDLSNLGAPFLWGLQEIGRDGQCCSGLRRLMRQEKLGKQLQASWQVLL